MALSWTVALVSVLWAASHCSASVTSCKASSATSWSTGIECSMQLDIVRPPVVASTTPIAWSIRSIYGDPIVLVNSSVSVCDTSMFTCTFGSADFVKAPSSAVELENATFAKGTTTISFPASSSYVVALNVVVGSNGQQFLATLPVSVVLATTSAPPMPPSTAPSPAQSSLPPLPQEAPSNARSKSSVVLIVVGVVLALVLGTVFALLFSKLRKARANISSQQSSVATSNQIDASRVEVEMTATSKFAAPEPFSRRAYMANSFSSNEPSSSYLGRPPSFAGGPSSSYASAANGVSFNANYLMPSASGIRTSASEHSVHSNYVQLADQGARRPAHNYRR